MVPINKSNDDAEAANNAGPGTMIEDGITSGSGTAAGSQPRIMAEQSLNEYVPTKEINLIYFKYYIIIA